MDWLDRSGWRSCSYWRYGLDWRDWAKGRHGLDRIARVGICNGSDRMDWSSWSDGMDGPRRICLIDWCDRVDWLDRQERRREVSSRWHQHLGWRHWE